MIRIVAVALCLLVSSAQAVEPQPSEAPSIATPPSSSAPSSSAEGVVFKAPDGMELHADLYRGEPEAPTVLLLHAYRSQRADWAPLIPDLVAAGFNILNLDLRGHGESIHRGDAVVSATDLPIRMAGALLAKSLSDVGVSLDYLHAQGIQVTRVVLIGAAYGSMLAALATPKRPDIRGIVMLSPIARGYGVSIQATLHKYPGNLFTIVSRSDRLVATDTRLLTQAHPGAEEEIFFAHGGHGTALLDSKPEIRARIVEFVKANTGKSPDAESAERAR